MHSSYVRRFGIRPMKSIISSGKRDCTYEQVDKCELCGSTAFDPELKTGIWTLLRCRSCGLVFTSPRYTIDCVQKKYGEEYYEVETAFLKLQLKPPSPREIALARSLRKKCSGGSDAKYRSLDIGCGAGRIVSAFQIAGWDAWGYDQSLKAVEEGKQRGVQLCVGDILQAPMQHYDLITAFHVLEHMVHPQEFLRACHARLRPGGYYLVEVPDYGCRKAQAMRDSWPYLNPEIHLYQFTRSTLERMLIQANFQIIRASRIGGRRFFEEHNKTAQSAKPSSHRGWRSRFGKLGERIQCIPGVRSAARYGLWHLLGLGESIRILTTRAD
jgi:2-polyprenyl-3-methyl-5-hydroxy-6-metoxy-1,4-benzoquinol methylase